MLPILRILPVGGVFLAILILILALTPPGTRPFSPMAMNERGSLLDRDEHPEWRQVMTQTALRRAEELLLLRDLPDTPVRSEPAAADVSKPIAPAPEQAPATPIDEQKVAAVPSARPDSDPDRDDITGSIEESSGATIPVEIGAASSFELPVEQPEERPPVIRTPERAKPPHESKRKRPNRAARTKTQQPPPQPPVHLGFFEALFSGRPYQPLPVGVGVQIGAATPPLHADAR